MTSVPRDVTLRAWLAAQGDRRSALESDFDDTATERLRPSENGSDTPDTRETRISGCGVAAGWLQEESTSVVGPGPLQEPEEDFE